MDRLIKVFIICGIVSEYERYLQSGALCGADNETLKRVSEFCIEYVCFCCGVPLNG